MATDYRVKVNELNGSLAKLYKVDISLDRGFLMLDQLIDILFTKARELGAKPICIIPRDKRILIYFKKKEVSI